MDERVFLELDELGYYDTLSDNDKEFLKEMISREYNIKFKGHRSENCDEKSIERGKTRRQDLLHRGNQCMNQESYGFNGAVGRYNESISIDAILDNLSDILPERMEKLRCKYRYNDAKLAEVMLEVKELVCSSNSSNDVNIILFEVKHFIDDVLKGGF